MEAVLGPRRRQDHGRRDLDFDVWLRERPCLGRARVYYAMAKDGLFFRAIATTNRQHVPAAALFAQGLWASLARACR